MIGILPALRFPAKHNRMSLSDFLPPRSALYMPASNPRAIEKAQGLPADMIILDCEDAVKPGLKDEARSAAVAAAAAGFGDRIVAIRINGEGTGPHAADVLAVRQSNAHAVVVPKVESASQAEELAAKCGKPLFAMIETPRGVINAAAIAAGFDVVGLIAGTNDLADTLRLPPSAGRDGLILSLQVIVLAARSAGIMALDGVCNDLSDSDRLAAECAEGRAFGFDGKTLIHPSQIDTANRIWSPTEAELADAQALIAAASGGAERFEGRMIETMHVDMAKRLLARAER
jgi:(3S)-malyl-CoA thioesterase